ncbi:ABC transporter permease [Mucilaginibacter litoreus]|uniref:ABC transporter permease n=1 Tax=Mucilaginibacter litoreus TaxID=1048221 RepID=A0ABW3ASA1_9SPHI
MIKNYFKIALRGFRKHKFFTGINIIGLSIGISAALVIYLIVQFDFTFNKFNGRDKDIYRIVTQYSFSGEVGYNGGVCTPLVEAVKTDISGIEKSAPIYTLWEPRVEIKSNANAPVVFKKEKNIAITDGRYFDMFEYNWLAGSPKTSLAQPFQVVLTASQAKKYFPGMQYAQMLGQQVVYEDSVKTTVTGIVEDLKGNTDFAFHDFISYSTGQVNSLFKDYFQPTEWGSTNSASVLMVKLAANTSPANVTKQLNVLRSKRVPKTPENRSSTTEFHLQKLSDMHFDQNYSNFDGARTASKTTLYGLLVIAGFLLLLGCINFINLTTAQASQRAKEIGIRKTMGSRRGQLILQFMSETFLVTLFAVIISVGLTPVILKLFADFIPEGVKADFIHPGIILFLVMLTLVVSTLSGFYPALVLSGYKPVSVLKNQAGTNTAKTRNAWLRKSLTVTQFVIAQFFIMATILVSKQIYYALHKDLGFKKDAILTVHTPWKGTADKKDVFRNKISAIPQISMMAVGGEAPSSGGIHSTEVTYKDGKKEVKVDLQQKFGDENYVKVYGIKFLAGRNLTEADTGKATIINATYARALGFKNPADAVGITLDYNSKQRQVVGVMADFYQKSLRSPIKPLAIIEPARYNNRTFHLALKPQTAGGHEWKTAISTMEKAWKEVYPDDEFDYSFFDEDIAKFYTEEQHTSTLLSWATGLSVLISCLGLLGLAMYTTSLRTKEIGVRKVLGATVTQIVTLLSTELIWLIVLAFVLVTPLAYYAMHKWMENFADRTTISWWIFALSGAGMLFIALCTLSLQTVKAAVSNPVKSLRSE